MHLSVTSGACRVYFRRSAGYMMPDSHVTETCVNSPSVKDCVLINVWRLCADFVTFINIALRVLRHSPPKVNVLLVSWQWEYENTCNSLVCADDYHFKLNEPLDQISTIRTQWIQINRGHSSRYFPIRNASTPTTDTPLANMVRPACLVWTIHCLCRTFPLTLQILALYCFAIASAITLKHVM